VFEIIVDLKHLNFLISLHVCAKELDENGMVCDFYELKRHGRSVLASAELSNNTVEIANQLQEELKKLLDCDQHWLGKVVVKRLT
jgi:6-pyruvoyl-tetrahydropterin synthase